MLFWLDYKVTLNQTNYSDELKKTAKAKATVKQKQP